MDLLDRLVAQLSAVQTVWLPFLLALIIVGIGMWRAMGWRYGATIETLEHRLKLRDDEIARQNPQPALPTPLVPASAPGKADERLPSATTREVSRETAQGRVFLGKSMTPKALMEICRNKTRMQAKKAVEVYVGKWMKIAGTVSNITDNESWITVHLETVKLTNETMGDWYTMATIALYFRGQREHLEVLQKGDMITAIGEIETITQESIGLEKCELD